VRVAAARGIQVADSIASGFVPGPADQAGDGRLQKAVSHSSLRRRFTHRGTNDDAIPLSGELTAMNKRACLLALVLATSFLLSAPASAGVLYDNGPINGNIGSWSISYNNVMSESFTLTGTSTLTGVQNLGIWIASTDGGVPASLGWRIGDSPEAVFGTGGSVVALTNTLVCSHSSSCGSNGFDVYASSFSLPDIVLGPGTYYLTLDFGETSGFASLYWDVNNGPSAAYRNAVDVAGSPEMTSGSNSGSFRILGDGPEPTGAPEPASIAMFLAGLALFAGAARRKMRA
jgi:hypothetical protein